MNDTLRRLSLYGGASALLAGLGCLHANRSDDADVTTLLSSADVQLRLAHSIPAVDATGLPLASRDNMITTAETNLAAVERIEPGMAVTAEFQGFAHMLRQQYEAAAASYSRALQCKDCQVEQSDVLAFNQARMLAKAGRLEQALAVFRLHAEKLDSRFGHQRVLEEAAILRQLGRSDEASACLETVHQDVSAAPMASLQAGLEYVALERFDAAEAMLARAATEIPIADYHRALLKLRIGDVDTGLGLLGRAATAQPAEVRRRLREEAAAWSAVAGDARFQEITRSGPAAPAR